MTEYPNVLVKDLYDMIHDDRWGWFCCWGDARTGKSSLCLLLGYWIYKDWDKVLNSVVFNLPQLLHKLKHGLPERWPTTNKLHMRIPYLIWDDFACHAGKAKSQHEQSFDLLKGSWDSLGVKLAVIVANMILPSSPTEQLRSKFTHELFVYKRGHVKYDRVQHQQDFFRFQSRAKKIWRTDFPFEKIPNDVFQQYDEMRCSLAEEVLVAIEDVIATTELSTVIKRIQPMDKTIMETIKEKGPLYARLVKEEFGDEGNKAIVRMKARGLINPVRISKNYYKYDMSNLGFEVLAELNKPKVETKSSYSS